MKNRKQKPIQRRMIFWRCTTFRLAKPTFFRYNGKFFFIGTCFYQQDHRSVCLLKHFIASRIWIIFGLEWNYHSMLASIRITACLFQQILVQCSVTLALSVTQLPAAPISSDRRVPRTEIPSVQLIVVPRSVNIATSPEMSWTALFEGVLTAQVKKKKKLRNAWEGLELILQFRCL